MGKLRSRLTYANVISTLCLFMLLGGGAYAATKLPKNSVGAKQIKNGAITGKKIKKASIDSSKLTPATVASLQGGKGERGAVGAQGVQGAQGAPGDPGAYATVDTSGAPSPPKFIGTHPGFLSVERVAPTGATEAEQEAEAGIYCLTPGPGTDISHPLTSTNWADSSAEGAFVEPFARETAFSRCAEGQLEIRTFKFFGFDPGVPHPGNEVSFTVFAPGA